MRPQAFIWIVLVTIVVSLQGVVANPHPVSANHTTVGMDKSPAFVTAGGSTVINLWVRGLKDTNGLASFDITLKYDPSVVKVDSVDGGDSPFNANPAVSVDGSAGEVNISAAQTRAGVTEDVRVAAITLSGLGSIGDSTSLSFTQIDLRDQGGEQIGPATGVDGSVTMAVAIVTVGSALVPLRGTTVVPVTVDFSPEGGLAGYNLSIAYDPASVEIDKILPGDSPFGGTPIFQINQEEGFANIVGFHGNRPGPTGKMVVMRLSLKGVVEGESLLKVTVKDLVDALEADSWPAAAVNGLATVVLPSEIIKPPTPVIATPPARRTPRPPHELIRVNVSPRIGVEFATPNGEVSLKIPSGAAPFEGFVELRQIFIEEAPPPPAGAALRTVVEIGLLDSDGEPLVDVLLKEAVTLTMVFTSEDLSSAGENAIVIQRYEPILGQWIQLPTAVDTTELAATAMVNRFSIFGLIIGQTAIGEAGAPAPVSAPEATRAATAVPSSAPTATLAAGPTVAPATAPTASPPTTPLSISTPPSGATPTPPTTPEGNFINGIQLEIMILIAGVAAAVLGVVVFGIYRVTR